MPRPDKTISSPSQLDAQGSSTKRNADDKDENGNDVDMTPLDDDVKRPRISHESKPNGTPAVMDAAHAHAAAAASYIPFLVTENLLPPKMPTRQEMETVLLGLRKKALMEEYFGEEGA